LKLALPVAVRPFGLLHVAHDRGLNMKASISVAIAGLAWFSTYVSAQPNKDLYELQERCGKRAAEVFDREYGSDKNGQTLFNYENHYSARLKKCFFLEITISYEREEEKPGSKIMRLFDINESKEYGTFVSGPTEGTPLACVVRGKNCQSESEWRQLVKPFMED
jgi:hypothetical protein